MGKNKERIRYKYKKVKKGFVLEEIKCPVCGNSINSTRPVQDISWNGKVVLLAECWSGDIYSEKPRHLFLIELDDLPVVNICKVKQKNEKG